MDCPLCFTPIVDTVFMTCSAEHSYCFKCILGCVESNETNFKKCPNCRGGRNYIKIIEKDKFDKSNEDFYSLDYFKKSLPILIKICNSEVENSYLVSTETLLTYIKNKEILTMAHFLLENNYPITKIVKNMNWLSKSMKLTSSDIIPLGIMSQIIRTMTQEESTTHRHEESESAGGNSSQ